ncbi:MAG: ABC transporter permease [Bacteroidota bacterium]
MTFNNIFRIIKRDSLTLVTNITGLSLGLAASILLTVFILYELNFDRHFTNSERIYRLNTVWIESGETDEMAINVREAYTEIPDRVAGIDAAVQFYRGSGREVIVEENRYKGLQLLYADPEFFRLFDLETVEGSLDFALNEPNTVVLTEEIALRIFGQVEVVGKSITMEEKLYAVSAVIEDIPPNTHFRFDMLMPMVSVPGLEHLGGLEFFTYYLIREGIDPEPVLKTIKKENTRILTEKFSGFGNATFDSAIEALHRLHMYTNVSWDLTPPGSMKTIFIMLFITIAVMGLALSNFMNLYILNGAKRSKEIGIRKVAGAGRKNMIQQFYLETFVVVSIAFLAGTLIAELLLPAFGTIMQRESFAEISRMPALYMFLLAIYLLTILLSGFYPALLLSRASPIPLILGRVNPAGDKRFLLRLVSVLQISIAIFLLSTLLGINAQTRFLKNHAPGYNPNDIVLIRNLNQKLINNYPALQDQLLNIPGIEQLAASSHTIGAGQSGQGIMMYGDDPDKARSISEYRIHPGLCDLYQFRLLAGRFLDPDRVSDRAGVILNEAAVTMLGGKPSSIVGESVVMFSDPMEVIGVVEDFNYQSAAQEIGPLVMTAYSEQIRVLSIRTTPGSDPQKILGSIHKTIQSFDPSYVMISRFATDIYEGYYQDEERLQKILLAGSVLSILIVLLGIYALVSHNIISRTKEIGIRKVMGGSTKGMMALIYTSTLKWSFVAAAMAVPLSWLYLKEWLSNSALRIPVYWWIFACSIIVVVLFQTLITLGLTRRTARRNPVVALRYE